MIPTSPRSHVVRHRRRVRVTAGVGAALCAGMLVACAHGGPAEEPVPSPAAEPTVDATPLADDPPALSPAEGPYRVGDCWQEDDYDTAADWRSWEGTDAVDCDEAHNTITYGVGELADDYPYPPAGERLTEEAWSLAMASCGNLDESLGLRKPLPPLHRLKTFMYLPTPEQWASGARFARCDVGLREWDRPRSDRTLAPLEHTLTTLGPRINGHPLGFEMCYLEVEGSDEMLLISCTGDYTWRWLEDFEPTNHVGGPYPGTAVFESLVQDRCEMQTLGPAPGYSCWASYPSEDEWAEGMTTIRMWMSKID